MPDKREALKSQLSGLIARGEEVLESEEDAVRSESIDYPRRRAYPGFVESYQRWYSLALPVVSQVLPDRAAEFAEFYAGTKTQGGAISAYIERRDDRSVFDDERTDAFRRGMSQQVFLLKAAADRLDSILADIRGVLEAEIFDTTLDGAQELFVKKHLRGAGVVAGVVLEMHLKDACRNHNVKLRKQKPSIGDLNDVLKNEGVYDMPPWRRIQHLADIRNLCGHDREREPTADEVDELLRGVGWAVKTLF